MQTRLINTRNFLLLLLILTTNTQFYAQNSAFNYQGMLQAAGLAANGQFDLQFKLFDAAAQGNQIGQTLDYASVVVRNGLFQVRLDFGLSAFNGEARYLEVGVRPSGTSGPYVPMAVREPISAVPYAITARNFSGTLDGDVVGGQQSTRIRSIQGRGISGRTPREGQVLRYSTLTAQYEPADVGSTGGGIRLEIVKSNTVQAVANTGYVIDHPERVDVVLPAVSQVGDIIRVAGASERGWRIVRSNRSQYVLGFQDGPIDWAMWELIVTPYSRTVPNVKVMGIAVGKEDIFISTDTKINVQPYITYKSSKSNDNWISVARFTSIGYYGNSHFSYSYGRNLNGQIVSFEQYGEATYYAFSITTDGGDRWQSYIYGIKSYGQILISDDGNNAIMANSSGLFRLILIRSTDYPQLSWSQFNNLNNWISLAGSSDLTKLVGIRDNKIHTSTDGGVNWMVRNETPGWIKVACSANSEIIGALAPNQVSISENGGQSWRTSLTGSNFTNIVVSDNGQRMAVITKGGPIHVTTDGGRTWTINESNRDWEFLAIANDGSRVLAADSTGSLFLSNFTGDTGGLLYGRQNASIELQYVGNGKFIPLAKTGEIWGY